MINILCIIVIGLTIACIYMLHCLSMVIDRHDNLAKSHEELLKDHNVMIDLFNEQNELIVTLNKNQIKLEKRMKLISPDKKDVLPYEKRSK